MKSKNTAAFAALTAIAVLALAGCGGGGSNSGSSNSAPVAPTATTLAGTNGDMSKYLGSWVSNCGIVVSGGGATTSVVNSFVFNAVNGDTVTGTATVSEYTSFNCTGTRTQSMNGIAIKYLANVAALGTGYTGFADRVALGTTAANATLATSFGFRQNFTKFQIASTSDTFSTLNLTYTKF